MKKLDRRVFLKLTSTGLAAMFLPSCSNAKVAHAPKPNILYINIDDMGASDLAYMGSRYYDSPNIDRLAKEGVDFVFISPNGSGKLSNLMFGSVANKVVQECHVPVLLIR